VFLRDIGVIARKPRALVHPEGRPEPRIKSIEPDEKLVDPTPVEQSSIYVEDIETLGFEYPAPNQNVAPNKLNGVATVEPSKGQTETRTS
jgi:hypothetical protein